MILSYSQLSEIFDDPTVKPMVKDFNKDRITLYSNDEEPEQPEEGEFGAENALDDNAGLDGELDAAEDGLGGPEEETGPLDITRPAPAQPPAPMQQSAIPEAPPGPATVASMAKRALARG